MPIKKKCKLNYGRQIVILQRGWVIVGNMIRIGNECEVTEGAVIRRWGTTSGLGEIASNGPTPETKLEPTPTLRFHWLTVIGVIECNEKAWTK